MHRNVAGCHFKEYLPFIFSVWKIYWKKRHKDKKTMLKQKMNKKRRNRTKQNNGWEWIRATRHFDTEKNDDADVIRRRCGFVN